MFFEPKVLIAGEYFVEQERLGDLSVDQKIDLVAKRLRIKDLKQRIIE